MPNLQYTPIIKYPQEIPLLSHYNQCFRQLAEIVWLNRCLFRILSTNAMRGDILPPFGTSKHFVTSRSFWRYARLNTLKRIIRINIAHLGLFLWSKFEQINTRTTRSVFSQQIKLSIWSKTDILVFFLNLRLLTVHRFILAVGVRPTGAVFNIVQLKHLMDKRTSASGLIPIPQQSVVY